MEWYWWLLLVVVCNWGLPMLTWVYPLVAWLVFRDIRPVGFHGPFLKFRLLGDDRVFWWGDHQVPCNEYVIVGRFGNTYQISDGTNIYLVMEDAPELDLMEPWHTKSWSDWSGMAVYWMMLYRDRPAAWDDKWVERTIAHEAVHCTQFAILGALLNLSYILHALFIYLFQKDKHPYLDCWAERQARRVAGQEVDIPRDQWPHGPGDRWPWW